MREGLTVDVPADGHPVLGISGTVGKDGLDGAPPSGLGHSVSGSSLGGLANGRYPASKLKLDELFLHWLSLPESQRLMLALLDNARAGRPLAPPVPSPAQAIPGSGPGGAGAGAHAHGSISGGSSWTGASSMGTGGSGSSPSTLTPPLSPQKASPPRSPSTPTKQAGGGAPLGGSPPWGIAPGAAPANGAATTAVGDAIAKRVIPPFYFPTGRPVVGVDAAESVAAKARALFAGGGLRASAMAAVVREACGLPGFLGPMLHAKLAPLEAGPNAEVSLHDFLAYWLPEHARSPPAARLFALLRPSGQGAPAWVTYTDLRPVMAALLSSHPGLEFLADTPEFQERYAETCCYRMLYGANRAGDGRLTAREIAKSDLLPAMFAADGEEDINKVLKYFSYEHFYVVYCKFWELDADHDLLLGRDDLLRYGAHGLTFRAVERVFAGAGRPLASGTPGKMGYEDFVWFILSEEDKTSTTSLEYWFRVCDLDGDGRLLASDLRWFYEEQLQRMDCLSQEPVAFEDVLCQLWDLAQPAAGAYITLRDLKRCRLGGHLFNMLLNLNKFIALETRDPFQIRLEREEPNLTDWDRFARTEYARLAAEEDAAQGDNPTEPAGADDGRGALLEGRFD